MPAKSLYVHIPFCRSKCPYCGFFSKPIADFDTSRYVDALIQELNHSNNKLSDVETVYIGGGTPTILPEKQLYRLVENLTKRFAPIREFNIETNPDRQISTDYKKLAQYGVRRVSVGVQSLENRQLEKMKRRYKAEDIEPYLERILNAGIENIGIDLIFALPGSRLNSWKSTLDQAISMPVKHIAAYSLSFDEGSRWYALLRTGKLKAVDEETARQMYLLTIERLNNAGFRQYEISNFAAAGFECRHNLTYWHNDEYIGIGAAAGSFCEMTRSENIADIHRYIETVQTNGSAISCSQKITKRAYCCETAVLELRTNAGIDIEGFKQKTGVDLHDAFGREIAENIETGMLERNAGRLSLTKHALPIADSVMSDFAS